MRSFFGRRNASSTVSVCAKIAQPFIKPVGTHPIFAWKTNAYIKKYGGVHGLNDIKLVGTDVLGCPSRRCPFCREIWRLSLFVVTPFYLRKFYHTSWVAGDVDPYRFVGEWSVCVAISYVQNWLFCNGSGKPLPYRDGRNFNPYALAESSNSFSKKSPLFLT